MGQAPVEPGSHPPQRGGNGRARTTCVGGGGCLRISAPSSGIPILAVFAALVCAPAAASYPPGQPHLLTTVAQVRALTLEQARQRYPIHLKGVITYRAPEYQLTFFQDETAGIFVFIEQSDLQITVGSLVEVDGRSVHARVGNRYSRSAHR